MSKNNKNQNKYTESEKREIALLKIEKLEINQKIEALKAEQKRIQAEIANYKADINDINSKIKGIEICKKKRVLGIEIECDNNNNDDIDAVELRAREVVQKAILDTLAEKIAEEEAMEAMEAVMATEAVEDATEESENNTDNTEADLAALFDEEDNDDNYNEYDNDDYYCERDDYEDDENAMTVEEIDEFEKKYSNIELRGTFVDVCCSNIKDYLDYYGCDKFYVHHQKDNKYDANACSVHVINDPNEYDASEETRIGYLPKEIAGDVAKVLDNGYTIIAYLQQFIPDEECFGGCAAIVNVSLNIE